MPNDKNNDCKNNDRKVSGGEATLADQEISRMCGVSLEQARQLIRAYGTDTTSLVTAARQLGGKSNVRSSRK